jgi:hypothetical protein
MLTAAHMIQDNTNKIIALVEIAKAQSSLNPELSNDIFRQAMVSLHETNTINSLMEIGKVLVAI